MKTRFVLSCAVAVSLVGLVPLSVTADPAPGMSGPATKVVIEDSAITSSIKAQYQSDRIGGLGDVRVDTDDHGVVTLDGEVRTQDAADRAIAIAKATDGVREVRSDLEIDKDD
jgi:hyperosmotically inducible protein